MQQFALCLVILAVGICAEKRRFDIAPVNSGWSMWSKPQCSYCQCPSIVNGLGAVVSRRSCRTGRQCRGSEIRGVVCNRSCTSSGVSTQSIEFYVNAVCGAKKSHGGYGNLTGIGSQMTYYEDRACNIFCDTKNVDGSVVRKFWGDSLPDGTPCGNAKYCLEGKCLTLSCDSTALLLSSSECTGDLDKCLQPLSEVRVTWTGWSAWSGCSTTCGQGVKTRARSCVTVATSFVSSVVASGCEGHEAEKSSCNVANCSQKPHFKKSHFTPYNSYYVDYTEWSVWALCSQTCGEGVHYRERTCPVGSKCWGASKQESSCFIEACTQWGGWGYWSTCSAATRQRRRIRKCYGKETCPGNDLEVENC